MKLIDKIFKYRHFICFCSWVIAFILIVIDWKFISHVYGNRFQWGVAIAYICIWYFCEFCIVDKEPEDEPIQKQ